MDGVGIAVGLGLSFLLLYTRKSAFLPFKQRMWLTGVLFVVGALGLLIPSRLDNNHFMLFWGLCVPFCYLLVDRFFRMLSFKFHDRDLILWLRHSDEIDAWGKSPKLRASDIVFSLLLLFGILFAVAAGAMLMK